MSSLEYAKKAGMTLEEWKKASKFSGMDLGWIIMCIGMAIGAGIVFLPLQVGLVGLWVYIVAAAIGYPILYQFQKLYIQIMANSDKCEDFAGIISGYLGRNWGFFLGFLYFVFTTIVIFLYSTALTNDSASFLQTFGVTETLLSDNIFYGLAVICCLVLIASQGEKLLFKVSSGMVLTKLLVIAFFGVVMVQYWNFGNIGEFPSVTYLIKNSIVMLPLTVLSITFFIGISPVVISYRAKSDNKVLAYYRSMRVMKIAFWTLWTVVVFYALSFNIAVGHEQAVAAYEANISSLAMAAKSMDGAAVRILSLILNIFAVVTAFFSVFLSFRDSCYGIAMNVLLRYVKEESVNKKMIKYGISVFCVCVSWGAIALNAPALTFTTLLSPLMGVLGCLMPVYLVMQTPQFKHYRDWKLCTISSIGILLVISPFLAFS
ncbi:serine transporter [Megasphaera vaginalis (ex Srinivasan et al. 2021)]|uniref:Serine transporter n=1 Tax=Megasphaera vaginalis (ex Srinivasan et al. 2021) TaxID=1111454 RepID=U7UVT1_9FIRM|nr:serine transporter [Megasphaera vaginalis (ex Srinivasan et al. 2021)]ERT62578.1 serine transporter [Megasphaera vaginalis (ex Srinivasan et al. 2021)]